MKKVNKRLLPVILAAVLSASAVLAGCSKQEAADDVTVRVGSLKGPTSMGLVELMDRAEKGEAGAAYEFTMAVTADEINAAFLKGDLDIVLIPANVAGVLYNKTDGQAAVIDLNTLGVLYLLEAGETIQIGRASCRERV